MDETEKKKGRVRLEIGDFSPATLASLQNQSESLKVQSLEVVGTSIDFDLTPPMSEEEWRKPVIQFLENSQNLCEISFFAMTGSDLEPFITGLEQTKRPKVSKMNIYCELDEKGRARLVEFFRNSSCSIREIHVEVRRILDVPSTFNSAFEGLLGNNSVEQAYFLLEFQEGLEKNISDLVALQHPTLRSLHLDSLSLSCVRPLFQSLATNTTLTSLIVWLFFDQLDCEGAKAMHHGLKENKSLKEFRWTSDCDCMSVVNSVFDAIKSTDATTYLSLRKWENDHEEPDARSLGSWTASLIEKSRHLEELSIDGDLQATGMTAILRAVENRPNLKKLRINYSGFSDSEYTDEDGNSVADQLISSLPKMLLENLEVQIPEQVVKQRLNDIMVVKSSHKTLQTIGFVHDRTDEDSKES